MPVSFSRAKAPRLRPNEYTRLPWPIAQRPVNNTALILLNIPLALVGGIVGLWLAGENLSVPSSIGFISLFGPAHRAAGERPWP